MREKIALGTIPMGQGCPLFSKTNDGDHHGDIRNEKNGDFLCKRIVFLCPELSSFVKNYSFKNTFLAVHTSSIGDLVTQSLTHSVTH